jgi:hypothetical protein
MRKDILKGILLGTGIFAGAILLFTSCVRERDFDTSFSVDQTTGEYIYSNALDIADDAATKNTGDLLTYYKTRGYCASIIHDKVSMPRTISINFGITNCLCTDGRRRNGIILVSYTGNNYKDSAGTVLVQFNNYTVDGHQVFGQVAVNNKGRNKNAQPYYDINVTGKYLNPLVLDTLSWNAKRTKTHQIGYDTPVFDDDVMEYIGTSDGMNQYKVAYVANIIKPLMKYPDCRYFKSGKVEQQPQGHALRTIDYGDGSKCDNDATVIFNAKSYNIKL